MFSRRNNPVDLALNTIVQTNQFAKDTEEKPNYVNGAPDAVVYRLQRERKNKRAKFKKSGIAGKNIFYNEHGYPKNF